MRGGLLRALCAAAALRRALCTAAPALLPAALGAAPVSERGRPRGRPARIVSLVPSITEMLFSLGFGDAVVGVTEWCVHPEQRVRSLPKVGGTKTPDVKAVAALAPDLVIVNKEENRRRDVEAMEALGLRVWLCYPRTVEEGVRLLEEVAAWGAPEACVEQVVKPARRALESARARRAQNKNAVDVFCPIWKNPWMTIGADTYIHDLLTLCGGLNVFAGEQGRRYPLVDEAQIRAAAPQVVLLPSEPYAFAERDAAELAALDLPAAQSGRIHLVDGTLVSWPGPRAAHALATFSRLFDFAAMNRA